METAGSAMTLSAGAKTQPRPQQTLVKKANAAQTAQFCEKKRCLTCFQICLRAPEQDTREAQEEYSIDQEQNHCPAPMFSSGGSFPTEMLILPARAAPFTP